MPGDFTYFRKYIILRNDYTNIDNINPKGHGKIEIKGNKGTMRINLENCEIDQEYRIYILKEDMGIVEEMDLGRVLTDERGRGKADININPRELEMKGFPVEKFDAIVIRRDKHILLSAYVDKRTEVITRYIDSIVGASGKEIVKEGIQSETELEQTETCEEVYEEETKPVEEQEIHMGEMGQAIEPMEENVEQQKIEYEELTDEDNRYYEDIEKAEVKEVQEVETNEIEGKPAQMFEENSSEEEPTKKKEHDKSEEVVEPILQESQNNQINQPAVEPEINEEQVIPWSQQFSQGIYNQQYNSYQSMEYIRRLNNKNQMTSYILSILKFFPQVQPLKVYLHGYTWWRIDDDGSNSNRGFLPYYNYLFSANYKYPFLYNSTTCMNQIMKYGHYLFGLYKEGNEVKYYVYAIPGKFIIKEHPFKGITGFNTWYESIDGIGYWILYIDPMTGKVIYPINPMIPTE